MLIAPHKTPTKRSAINGIGLIEVLVALVILAVGMLGIASLYVTTLQAKITAQSRMQAINLADDMADRIRANRLVSTPTIYQVAKTSAVLSSPEKSVLSTQQRHLEAYVQQTKWQHMTYTNGVRKCLPFCPVLQP